MQTFLLVLGVLAGLLLLAYLVGLAVPRTHSATSSATFSAAPEEVWRAITGWQSLPEWRKELSAVEPLGDDGGREGWVEVSRFGRMPMVVEIREEPSLLVLRIADPSLPFGGSWSFRLEPTGAGGTRLSITEDGEVKAPLFRFMARFLFGYHRTMRSYLRSLGRRFGETVEPADSRGDSAARESPGPGSGHT